MCSKAPSRRMERKEAVVVGNLNSSLCSSGFQTLQMASQTRVAACKDFQISLPWSICKPFPSLLFILIVWISFLFFPIHYGSTIIVPNLTVGQKSHGNYIVICPNTNTVGLTGEYTGLCWLPPSWRVGLWDLCLFLPTLTFLPPRCSGGPSLQKLGCQSPIHRSPVAVAPWLWPKCLLLLPTPHPQKYLYSLILNTHQTPAHVPQGSPLPVCLPSCRSVTSACRHNKHTWCSNTSAQCRFEQGISNVGSRCQR